jgi:head-tail adaptor
VRAGKLNKWVTLSRSPQTSGDSDGFFEPLDPAGVWAGIEPQSPSGDGRSVFHNVTMRFHAGVTMDTRIVYLDANRVTTDNPTGMRSLFVKGFQNVNEQDTELRLLCEEVIS